METVKRETKKPFSLLSKQEKKEMVQSLQSMRLVLRSNSKKKRALKGGSKKAKKKPFKFDDPKVQAMFDLLPEDFKKTFGRMT